MVTRGLGKSHDVKSGSSRVKPSFEKRLFLRPGDEMDTVLLDDESYNIWEHGIFLKGDKQASKIKVTCPSDEEEGDPKNCRICNAMLRHDLIGRNWRGFLTVIDMSERVWKGKTYVHVKKFIALDKKTAMILDKKKETRGGSLVGAKIHLYRTDQSASSVGDDWEVVDIMDPRKRFVQSPQIAQTVEWVKKRDGTILTRKQALEVFVTPFDYDEVLAVDPKKVTYLLAYMGIDDSVQEGDAGGTTVNYDEPGQYAGDGGTDAGTQEPIASPAKKKGVKKKGVAKKKGVKKKGAKKKGKGR